MARRITVEDFDEVLIKLNEHLGERRYFANLK